MKFLISPAKSLNFKSKAITCEYSNAKYLEFSKNIMIELKKLSVPQIENLMKISNNLANLNYERFQNWNLPFDENYTKQAVFAFDGEVYNGLNANTLELKNIDYLQKNIRILSGLYGILNPLDNILPYRLEMGTSISIKKSKNLYEFWNKIVTTHLIDELESEEELINLASTEYFKVIDSKKIKNKIITPQFKDYKNGKLSTISFFAKKARGTMVRFAIKNKIENVDDLKQFNDDNYQFNQNLSSDLNWIFTR